MAAANEFVISALRQTVDLLNKNNDYQWGHMGACNCGHLARVVSPFSKSEIHQYALITREGDWNDMLNAYCSVSEAPIDMVIAAMINSGFTTTDLKNLEYLSDPAILKQLNINYLNKNSKDDLTLYLNTWANILEEQYLNNIPLSFDLTELLSTSKIY